MPVEEFAARYGVSVPCVLRLIRERAVDATLGATEGPRVRAEEPILCQAVVAPCAIVPAGTLRHAAATRPDFFTFRFRAVDVRVNTCTHLRIALHCRNMSCSCSLWPLQYTLRKWSCTTADSLAYEAGLVDGTELKKLLRSWRRLARRVSWRCPRLPKANAAAVDDDVAQRVRHVLETSTVPVVSTHTALSTATIRQWRRVSRAARSAGMPIFRGLVNQEGGCVSGVVFVSHSAPLGAIACHLMCPKYT